jgi:DNA polymerase III subunit alpha, Gram-positive type
MKEKIVKFFESLKIDDYTKILDNITDVKIDNNKLIVSIDNNVNVFDLVDIYNQVNSIKDCLLFNIIEPNIKFFKSIIKISIQRSELDDYINIDKTFILPDDIISLQVYDDNIINKINKLVSPIFSSLLNKVFNLNNYKLQPKLDETFLHARKRIDDLLSQASQASFEYIEKENKEQEARLSSKNKNFTDKSICDIKDGDNVCIQAKVFKTESIKYKEGSFIHKFWVTDETSSIIIKFFERPTTKESKKHTISLIKEGASIKSNISCSIDTYEKNNLVGTISDISVLIKESDSEQKKQIHLERVEFSAKSKMTAYDGISDPVDYAKKAKDLNITSIAINDRNSVQNYPTIYSISKKEKYPFIYSVELDVINNDNKIIINKVLEESLLSDLTYVVFDLETTGLFPAINEIIEFGAVKVKKGTIVERIDLFIKPNKPIPAFITEITKITNDMLKDSKTFKDEYETIRNFISDSVLIAHNGADFDLKFLNYECFRNNLEQFNNMLIDTMNVSRAINDFKSHRLGYIASKYKIDYDDLIAHRADYDAEVLLHIWNKFIYQLSELGIKNINDLDKLKNEKRLLNRTFGHKTNVYALNQDSIKQIYKLLSLSLTDRLYDTPKIFFQDIKSTKNIMISNNPSEGQVWNSALYDDDVNLEKTLSLYDFILLPCFDNIKHEVNRSNMDYNDYKNTINRIYKIASKINIKVIGSSDSYYCEKSEEIFRRVYIYTKGIGGRLHRLFKKNSKKDSYPLNYLKSSEELIEDFSFMGTEVAKKIVVDNSLEIFKKIDCNLKPIPDGLHTPKIEGVEEKMRELVYNNLKLRYGDNPDKIISERVEKELDSIIGNGFSVVYWISHLLVKTSNDDGYLVGSRGSVGSSFVAYLMDITEVNPLESHYICRNCFYTEFVKDSDNGFDLEPKKCSKCSKTIFGDGHDIPFETFLGFEGNKVPDIDLNFSGEYQTKAHDFVKKMFGEEHTYRAGTIGTIAEKTAFGFVKGYFESVGEMPNDAEVERISKGVQGVKRTTGQHPGGIIVVPKNKEVYDFFPYNFPADDINSTWKTTHFEFEAIHDNLLKLDILGHDDPTSLKYLYEWTGVNPQSIPTYDKKVMSIFTSSLNLSVSEENSHKIGTTGIPEFGTDFVKRMLSETKPQTFSDLIRISGLSHGTDVWTGNARDLVMNNSLSLKELICCRDDIMVYLIRMGLDHSKAFLIMEDVRKGKGLKE